jgi:hypothetical protein
MRLLAIAALLPLGVAIGLVAGPTKIVTRANIVTTTETRIVVHTSTRVVTRPPTGHGISFDPGALSGEIVVEGAQWVESLVGGKVIGQLTYTGGMGCRVLRYLELDGIMYDEAGRIADTGFDNRTQVSTGSTYPFEIDFTSNVQQGPIRLVAATARC